MVACFLNHLLAESKGGESRVAAKILPTDHFVLFAGLSWWYCSGSLALDTPITEADLTSQNSNKASLNSALLPALSLKGPRTYVVYALKYLPKTAEVYTIWLYSHTGTWFWVFNSQMVRCARAARRSSRTTAKDVSRGQLMRAEALVDYQSCATKRLHMMHILWVTMHVRVCVYVCMCVFIYVFMYVCMSVCMHVCMYECVYGCMYVCMYVCICRIYYIYIVSLIS